MKVKNQVFRGISLFLASLLLLFSFAQPVYASAAEAMTDAELLRQSFKVIEGGSVDSSFTGFKVIEGGLAVADKEAMVSSFGSQILAGAKTLGCNVAIAGGAAVTEYTALQVGYHALDAIMDSSAGDEITKLWLNTFSTCAYNGVSSLATEKAVLTSNMIGGLEKLLNKHYNGDFELNAGLAGNGVALGSDYFKNATKSGVEAYKALNSNYQATFVFNGDTSINYMTHYFVNGVSYGVISNGLLTLYNANGEPCTISNSSGKCTSSFVLGADFYGLDSYTQMTTFAITLGNMFKMISGSGIRLYTDSTDKPINTPVSSPIELPDTALDLPSKIILPCGVSDGIRIANGEDKAEVVDKPTGSDTDTNTNTDGSKGILDWLKSAWSIFTRILDAIGAIPSAIGEFFGQILKVAVQGDVSIGQATIDAFGDMLSNIYTKLGIDTIADTISNILSKLDTLDWLKTAWNVFMDILDAIAAIPTAIGEFFGKILKVAVQGDVSLGQATIDAFGEMINSIFTKLFVPSEATLTEITNLLDEKLPLITDLSSWVDDLMKIMQSPKDYASKLTFNVDMSKAENTHWDYGDSSTNALSASWYMKYKSTVDDIIVGIAWLIFLWNAHCRLPAIISAISTTTFAGANLEYQKYSVNTRTKKMRDDKGGDE